MIPYSNINELPKHIKTLTSKLKRIWLNVFNSAYKQHKGDEKKANMIANSAVKKWKEQHGSDYDIEFRDDIKKFMEGKGTPKERIRDDYGEDFIDQIKIFNGRSED